MTQVLMTGVTGLLSHQNKLDVVANNLANMNTFSYKAQRILFADLLYSNIRNATSGDSRISGTNPLQKGFGVGVAQTGRNFAQGVLTSTGQTFDFAIEGDGFFVVNNGENRYTRAGAFSLDRNGFLVDASTGGYVQRIGAIGEGDESNPAFQIRGTNNIRIPIGAGIVGRSTSSVNFLGNLPSSATPAAAEVLLAAQPYLAGSDPATTATLLNDLDSNTAAYVDGDEINLTGFTVAGDPISATFTVSGTSTLGDLVDFINTNLVGSEASIDTNGNLRIVANEPGPSKQRIDLLDATTNVGGTRFNSHKLVEKVKGKDRDTVQTSLQVFDARGQAHAVNVTMEKANGNSWDAVFELIDTTGTVIDGVIRRIEFAENGTYLGTFGTGTDSNNVEIHFDQMNFSQVFEVNFDQMTHLANRFNASVDQDGFPPGNLINVGVSASGVLEGIATNGRRIPIAQLAIASFFNMQGLEASGQNYFRETVNSGIAQVGTGGTSNIGAVRGGQLEASNVDVAMEFTQLIVAQRGFSANARTITVANEILQELNNLLR